MRKRPVIEKTTIELHQHDMGNFLKCPQKYYLSNVRGYYPIGMKKALNIGDLFSKCVYWMHKGTDISECMAHVYKLQEELIIKARSQAHFDELETSVVIVQAMLLGYQEHFLKKDVFRVTKFNDKGGIEKFDDINIKEIIPEYTLGLNFDMGSYTFAYWNRLDGKIITPTLPWILELKSTAQFDGDLLEKLNTDFQINSYWMVMLTREQQQIGGILYRYIKKPSIRQKQNETIDQFQRRLTLDYCERPENYFLEESLYFNQPALDRFKKDFDTHLNRLLMCYAMNDWPHIGLSCDGKFGLCEYLKYCSNPTQETLDTFYMKGKQ
jgi:hypothetical protein